MQLCAQVRDEPRDAPLATYGVGYVEVYGACAHQVAIEHARMALAPGAMAAVLRLNAMFQRVAL